MPRLRAFLPPPRLLLVLLATLGLLLAVVLSGHEAENESEAIAELFDEVIVPAHENLKSQDPMTADQVTLCKDNVTNVTLPCGREEFDAQVQIADYKVVILGSGPAGMSAALYAARAEMEPLVVSKSFGQLELTSVVDNFPGFENGIGGVEMLHAMQRQAARFGARFKTCDVTAMDLSSRPFVLHCRQKGESLVASSVILATGARARWLGVPGEEELLSRGIHTCATCDGYFYRNQHVLVVGGGDTAMEQALFLARLCAKVTIVHRRSSFRASKAMAARALASENIEIVWDTVVQEFVADEPECKQTSPALGCDVFSVEKVLSKPKLGHVILHNVVTKTESVLYVPAAFVAIGHIPNTELVRDQVKTDEEGYVYTIPGSTRTSVTGIYAAGDVADSVYRQAITSAGTGAMAAMDAERWLCEHGC